MAFMQPGELTKIEEYAKLSRGDLSRSPVTPHEAFAERVLRLLRENLELKDNNRKQSHMIDELLANKSPVSHQKEHLNRAFVLAMEIAARASEIGVEVLSSTNDHTHEDQKENEDAL